MLYSLADGEETAGDVSDVDGRFELRGVPIGMYRLEVTGEGFAVFDRQIEIAPGPRAAALDDLHLAAEHQLSARVEDPEGHPLAGVEAWSLRGRDRRHSSNGRPDRPADAVSSADGTLWLTGVEATGSTVLLRKDGFRPVELPVRADDLDPVFVLSPAGQLILRVRGSDGEPVEGAEIRGLPRGYSGSGGSDVRTDATGEVRIEDLHEGPRPILVVAEGGLRIWRGVVELPPAGEIEELEIVLADANWVNGRVTGPTGDPVPMAQIELPDGPMGAFTSAPDGTFQVGPLGADAVTVVIDHPRYERLQAVIDPAVTPSIELRLEDKSVFIRGRLDGEVVASVGIDMRPAGGGQSSSTRTALDGSFELGPVRPGKYTLRIHHPGLEVDPAHQTVVVRAGLQTQELLVPVISAPR